MIADANTTVSVWMLLLVVVVMMMMMMMMVTSDVLPQSLLLGATVLKPHLDHTHVEPGLGTQSFAHLPRRLGAVVVGSLQGVQLLAVNCRPWSLAAAAEDSTAIVGVRTGIYTRFTQRVSCSLPNPYLN